MKTVPKKPSFFGFVHLLVSAVSLTIFATWGITTLSMATEKVDNDMILLIVIANVTLLLCVTILGLMWYRLFSPWNDLIEWIAFIKQKLINQQTVDDELRRLAIRIKQMHDEVKTLSIDHKPDEVAGLTGERLPEAMAEFQTVQLLARDLGFMIGSTYDDYLGPRVIYEPSELAKSDEMDYGG